MIDVAVIGAGLGGLAAAVHCARAGLRVEVFERSSVPGGFARTWTRGPYTFEGSLHALDAVGPGEPNRRVLDDLGIGDALDLVEPAEVRVEQWRDGRRFRVPRGREALLTLMADAFGDDVSALLDRAAEAHRASFAALLEGAPGAREFAELTARSGDALLRDHGLTADGRALLGGIASWQGARLASINALNLLLLIHGYHVLGGRVPRGGSRALVDALTAQLTAHGGVLHLDRPVTGVSLDRRRCTGLTAGEDVTARHVVSAIAPPVLVEELLPATARPPMDLDQRALSRSLLRLTAGLTVDPALPYELALRGTRDGFEGLSVTARHVVDPDAAPAGHGIVSVSTPWDRGDVIRPARKEAIADRLWDVVESATGVGLRAHAEHVALAHPGTFARYGGVPGGSVFGYPPVIGQAGRGALTAETRVPHLWLAGGWVFPGPGQTAALISGRLAAHRILQACGHPGGVREQG